MSKHLSHLRLVDTPESGPPAPPVSGILPPPPPTRAELKTIPCDWTPEKLDRWADQLREQAYALLHSAWDLEKISAWMKSSDPKV